MARTGAEMRRHLTAVLHDAEVATALARHGRQTVLARHTCAHRVDELLNIYAELKESRENAGVAA
jgi:spore maturation protein CgeB